MPSLRNAARLRYGFLLVSLLFFLACAGWFAWNRWEESKLGRLNVAASEFDFGEARNDQTITHAFQISNSGGGPLTLTHIRADCGCVLVDTPTPTVVPPGGQCSVTVRLSLNQRRGIQRRQVVVESDDPSNSTAVLTLQGIAVSPVKVEPETLSLEAGTSQVQTVQIDCSIPVQIVRVASGHPSLQTELETIQPGNRYRVRVTLNDGTTLDQPIESQIYLLTDYPAESEIEIPVRVGSSTL